MVESSNNEDVLDYQGVFPGPSIKLPQLCTASDGRRCHILDQLPACNKLLSVIETRLEEKTADKLSLVSLRCFHKNYATEAEGVKAACALTFWLLKSHRCLDAIVLEISDQFQAPPEHQKLIVRSLRTVPALRNLEITVALTSVSQMPAFSCLASLTLLDTLEFTVIDYPEMAPVLGRLLETSFSLTTLRLALTSSTVSYGRELWDAMATCKMLNSLQVCFFYPFSTTKDDYMPFFQYLEKTSTLSSVYVALEYGFPTPWLTSVLKALYGNKGLMNVTLEWFIVDLEEGMMIETFLTENSSIRSFELRQCSFGNKEADTPCYDTDDFGTLTPLILPWLSILKTNRVLQNLLLNFAGFCPAECAAFLEELSRNRHIRSVIIEDIQEYCLCLSRRGEPNNNGGKFGPIRVRRPAVILAECEQIRQMSLYISTPEDLAWFAIAALPLELRYRVTDFTLSLAHVNLTQESASGIAEFIEASNTLSRLVINFNSWNNDSETSSMPEIRKTILKAVRRNSSIKDLAVWYRDCTGMEAEELACIIRESKTICRLDLDVGLDGGKLFLTHILPGISHNYMLVSASIWGMSYVGASGYHNLLTVAERNRRLVGRAAKFVAGSSNITCAEAIEYVSSNPTLVNELCELASVGETEAFAMISKRLRGLQDLDEFMQFSGVVKRRITCYMNTGGGLQLDDVDEFCWRCVRKYLRLADVEK